MGAFIVGAFPLAQAIDPVADTCEQTREKQENEKDRLLLLTQALVANAVDDGADIKRHEKAANCKDQQGNEQVAGIIHSLIEMNRPVFTSIQLS